MSAHVDQKALRLLVEGRVRDAPDQPRLLHVDGDHGIYQVVVGARVQMCSCPASGRCSHIEAAVRRVLASDTELALLDAAVANRRAQLAAQADDLFDRVAR